MSIFQPSSGPTGSHKFETKAGRMLMEGSRVKPDPKLGKIIISEDLQGMTHFQWIDLNTNLVNEDYIVFPGESKFVKAVQTKSRVYILELPNHKSFFWFQEDDPEQDSERCRQINDALGNSGFLGTQGSNVSTAPQTFHELPHVPQPALSIPQEESKQPQVNQEQLSKLLEAFARTPIQKSKFYLAPDLDDILTPDELDRISEDHDLMEALAQQSQLSHLPEGQQSPEYLRPNLLSPQFRQALQVLSYAVQREGESVMYSLGLAKVLSPGLDAMIKAFEKRARDSERER